MGPRGWRFESFTPDSDEADVAQLVERVTYNHQVVSSNLTISFKRFNHEPLFLFHRKSSKIAKQTIF